MAKETYFQRKNPVQFLSRSFYVPECYCRRQIQVPWEEEGLELDKNVYWEESVVNIVIIDDVARCVFAVKVMFSYDKDIYVYVFVFEILF